MKTLKNFDFKGKKVLVRCDFQVPLSERGEILDDFKIRATIPTIEYLIEKKAKVILMSHWKPMESQKKAESLRLMLPKITELLKKEIKFLDDCIGEKIEKEVNEIKEEEVVLLENLRFYDAEEKNDENFAKNLAELGDIYINDAFGACHRKHASVVSITKFLPSGMGLLLEKEIKILSKVLENPWRPLIVIIGGVKIFTKIGLIEQFLERADHLLLGGEIANTVLIGKGISLDHPVLDDEDHYLPTALSSQPKDGAFAFGEKPRVPTHPKNEIIKKIEKIDLTNPKLHLPIDGLISLQDMAEGYFKIGAVGSIKKEEKVFDIGPDTIKIFSEIIKQAKMIFWSGPLGLFEDKKFEKGTKEIAESIVRNHLAFKIAGGGETTAALNKFGLLDKFDHISTGGGAMLEFLSGEKLPGIEALK